MRQLGGCSVEQELWEGAGFFEHHGRKMEHFGHHYSAPTFWGRACPRGELPSPPGRVGRERGEIAWGEGLKRAHDEPGEPRATPTPTPGRKAPKPSGSAAAAVAGSSGGLEGLGGPGVIEAAACRCTCEALGDFNVPSTADIVSGVAAGLGKPRPNISRDIGEFSRTCPTSLREANSPPKEELKAAHAEDDAQQRKNADLETRLAEATSSAHDWHLKAKKLETQLQAAKANEEWARSIVAHSVTRSAPPPQGSGSQGSGSQGSQSASPARGLPPRLQ